MRQNLKFKILKLNMETSSPRKLLRATNKFFFWPKWILWNNNLVKLKARRSNVINEKSEYNEQTNKLKFN